MKKITLFFVLLCSVGYSQLKETAWHSSNAMLVDEKGVIKEKFNENFVVKFDYETKIITFSFSDKTEAYIYASVSHKDNIIIYFLNNNQKYDRIAIINGKNENNIMLYQKEPNQSLILNNIQVLYTK